MNNSTIEELSDDKLLNLINNTILTQTDFGIEDFTGGSVGITSTNNHTKTNYTVSLFFGYKSKKPLTRKISIEKELFSIWSKALLLKTESIKVKSYGMNYTQLINLTQSLSINSNKYKNRSTSTVDVDLPIDLPPKFKNDIYTLYNLNKLKAAELSNLNLKQFNFTNETLELIKKFDIHEIVNYSINYLDYLIELLKENEECLKKNKK